MIEIAINSDYFGSTVRIDGRDIPEVRNILVCHRAGEEPTIQLELNGMNLKPGTLFSGPAKSVSVEIVSLPGYKIVSKPCEDGTVEYYTEPVED